MRNIYSISIVKNEADIIESFVRYNHSYLDGMMIIDHDSTDNTAKILKNLKNEGYNIKYFKWNKLMHQQGKILTKFMKILIKEKNPDIIIPLDADEFLVNGKQNPRIILEKLSLDYVHFIEWKTYLPSKQEGKSEEIAPKNMIYTRNRNFEEHYKIIIPVKLIKKYRLKLKNGNHDCINLNEQAKKNLDSVKMAHFPIRSKHQLISNILIGSLNTLCMPYRNELESWHWLELFEKINNNEELDIFKIANEYSSKNAINEKIDFIYDPINTDFCDNTLLKYQNLSEIDSEKNLINYSKSLAIGFRKIAEENIELKKEISKKNKIIANLHPTKKWIKYKVKNLLNRMKKIIE